MQEPVLPLQKEMQAMPDPDEPSGHLQLDLQLEVDASWENGTGFPRLKQAVCNVGRNASPSPRNFPESGSLKLPW
jgi:hypothetical protein